MSNSPVSSIRIHEEHLVHEGVLAGHTSLVQRALLQDGASGEVGFLAGARELSYSGNETMCKMLKACAEAVGTRHPRST